MNITRKKLKRSQHDRNKGKEEFEQVGAMLVISGYP